MKRILSALLAAVTLLALLSSCGAKDAARTSREPVSTVAATEPPQQEMPAAEKEVLMRRLEYSLLCAAIDARDRIQSMKGWDVVNTQAYLGDYDSDGDEDLICGYYSHTFDVAERTNGYRFSQSGTTMYTDKDGTLYLQDSMGAAYDYELDGMLVEGFGDSVWYSTWNGSEWFSVLSEDLNVTREMIVDDNQIFVRYGKTISEEYFARIGENSVTEAEFDAHCAQLGLKRLGSHVSDLVSNRTDAIYTDDLLAETERYLNSVYGCSRLDTDIDGDGMDESIFFITGDLVQVWMDCISYDNQVELIENAQFYLKSLIDPAQPRTCLLVADREGNELVLDALCVQAAISVYDGMDIRFSDGFLWLEGQPAYRPDTFDQFTAASLSSYIKVFGYSDCIIRSVDVSDIPGAEYLCLCQRDGVWYLLVFVFENGNPRPIYALDLSASAVYLVEQDGKQCLLAYNQYSSGNYTGYNYSLLRFDDSGISDLLDSQYIGYYNSDADASAVARFFEKLNVYLIKIIVIRDPYRLTGREWMKQEETAYGTVPAEPQPDEPQTDTQEPVMGFVQINDPGSWLNLRQGPGTNYPCVLVDENDPDSFVKQALGAPVTVLETIETGDSANPVWVKVRISYGNREYVGYSSKTYIRIPVGQ